MHPMQAEAGGGMLGDQNIMVPKIIQGQGEILRAQGTQRHLRQRGQKGEKKTKWAGEEYL